MDCTLIELENAYLHSKHIAIDSLCGGRKEKPPIDPDDYDYYGDDYEHDLVWIQEPTKTSYNKLKAAAESLGIQCLNITFGEFDPNEVTLRVLSIKCSYDDSDPQLLHDLLNDEVYMMKGAKYVRHGFDPAITGYEKLNDNCHCIALYFKR